MWVWWNWNRSLCGIIHVNFLILTLLFIFRKFNLQQIFFLCGKNDKMRFEEILMNLLHGGRKFVECSCVLCSKNMETTWKVFKFVPHYFWLIFLLRIQSFFWTWFEIHQYLKNKTEIWGWVWTENSWNVLLRRNWIVER